MQETLWERHLPSGGSLDRCRKEALKLASPVHTSPKTSALFGQVSVSLITMCIYVWAKDRHQESSPVILPPFLRQMEKSWSSLIPQD